MICHYGIVIGDSIGQQMIMRSQVRIYDAYTNSIGIHSYAYCALVSLKQNDIVSKTKISNAILLSYPHATKTCPSVLSFY